MTETGKNAVTMLGFYGLLYCLLTALTILA